MSEQLDIFRDSGVGDHDQCECGRRKMRESTGCISCTTSRRNRERWRPAAERFWAKVEKTPGCWLWRGSHNMRGYSTFHVEAGRSEPKKVLAHRYAYELLVGPIPDGLQIDHVCRNKGCVNPEHLEPVTPSENMRRGYEARRRVTQMTELPGETFEDIFRSAA